LLWPHYPTFLQGQSSADWRAIFALRFSARIFIVAKDAHWRWRQSLYLMGRILHPMG